MELQILQFTVSVLIPVGLSLTPETTSPARHTSDVSPSTLLGVGSGVRKEGD